MPVVEKFVSINGEGRCAGKLAAFIRFAGCNLRCSYCDTMWANEPGAAVQSETVAALVAWVRETGVECVTLTGGEPVLQPHLAQLVRVLCGEAVRSRLPWTGSCLQAVWRRTCCPPISCCLMHAMP